jgi:hypothetical protein
MEANHRESAVDVGTPVGSSGAAARMKGSLTERVAEAKSAAASGLEHTASSLHSGADQVSGFGHSAADRIQATADYVRDAELEGIAADVRDLVRRYPTQLLVGAAVLGFFLARALSRSPH